MLKQRLLVIIVLLPIGILLVSIGGIVFNIAITLIMAVAAYEFGLLMSKGGWQPSKVILVGGSALICLMRSFFNFDYTGLVLGALTMAAMTVHLFAFEKGRDQAPIDFAITLAGLFYIGWMGAYLISVRSLSGGLWWFMLIFPAVWLADSAAYLVGSRIGKTKLVPRLSPKKTWEGYIAGVLGGMIGAGLLALAWCMRDPEFTFWKGALVGLLMGAITPLGDLGESMFKRMVGEKDSSNLIPGHGGVFDRIDSWLWAGVIGYYLATMLWHIQ